MLNFPQVSRLVVSLLVAFPKELKKRLATNYSLTNDYLIKHLPRIQNHIRVKCFFNIAL